MSAFESLSQEFAVLIRGLRELHGAIVSRCDEPIEPAAAGLLSRVQLLSPVRPTDVACALSLDASTVSRQVASLVERGWVERERDPHDQRAHVLVVTPAGEQVVAALRVASADTLAQRLPDWTEADVTDFVTQLTRFNRDLALGAGRTEPVQARKAHA